MLHYIIMQGFTCWFCFLLLLRYVCTQERYTYVRCIAYIPRNRIVMHPTESIIPLIGCVEDTYPLCGNTLHILRVRIGKMLCHCLALLIWMQLTIPYERYTVQHRGTIMYTCKCQVRHVWLVHTVCLQQHNYIHSCNVLTPHSGGVTHSCISFIRSGVHMVCTVTPPFFCGSVGMTPYKNIKT